MSNEEPRSTGPYRLDETPIHLPSKVSAADPVVPLDGFAFDGESFGAYVAEHCSPEAPGRLLMIETTPTDWGAWECHHDGDEVVIVLEGKATFRQEIDGKERQISVGPGSTVINPRGVWHTADVEESLRAIYLTPCPGTEHRPR